MHRALATQSNRVCIFKSKLEMQSELERLTLTYILGSVNRTGAVVCTRIFAQTYLLKCTRQILDYKYSIIRIQKMHQYSRSGHICCNTSD